MKRGFAILLTALALASSAAASTRPAPTPVPGGPITIVTPPGFTACVLAGNPVVFCLSH